MVAAFALLSSLVHSTHMPAQWEANRQHSHICVYCDSSPQGTHVKYIADNEPPITDLIDKQQRRAAALAAAAAAGSAATSTSSWERARALLSLLRSRAAFTRHQLPTRLLRTQSSSRRPRRRPPPCERGASAAAGGALPPRCSSRSHPQTHPRINRTLLTRYMFPPLAPAPASVSALFPLLLPCINITLLAVCASSTPLSARAVCTSS